MSDDKYSKIPIIEAKVINGHGDELANLENEGFSNEDLEIRETRNNHIRKENFKNLFHNCGFVICIILFMGIAMGMIFLFYHWLTPSFMHFLSSEQIEYIKTLFFSALATNIAKEFYKKIQ